MSEPKEAEILIFSKLSLEPIFVDNYLEGIQAINAVKYPKGKAYTDTPIVYVKCHVGFSKERLISEFLRHVILEQIEVHVLW